MQFLILTINIFRFCQVYVILREDFIGHMRPKKALQTSYLNLYEKKRNYIYSNIIAITMMLKTAYFKKLENLEFNCFLNSFHFYPHRRM